MAYRLHYEFDGEQFTLVGQWHVPRMVVMPPLEQRPADDHVGLWADIRDATGRTLQVRRLNDPISGSVEIYGSPAGLHRMPIVRPMTKRVQVVVPDDIGADHVVLVYAVSAKPKVAKGDARNATSVVRRREVHRADLEDPR
jgi:hypothetical protein